MRVEPLRNLAFFQDLSAGDMKLLAPYFTLECFPIGTKVFDQGDRAVFLYLVVKGEVVIRYKPEDGPVMVVTHVQKGGIFGWSAAMGNPVYTSAAVCDSDSEVVHIRGTDLRRLCDEYPRVGEVILSRLAAVIAERKKSQQGQVTSLLANGIRQVPEEQGGNEDDAVRT